MTFPVPAVRLLALAIPLAFGSVSPLEAQDHQADTTRSGLPYLVTPPARAAETHPPLLLFLHGGDRSNTRHHPARYAAEAGIDFPFLVLAPHCAGGCSWAGVDFEALVTEVGETHAFDPERVYVTGYSMGGYGAWGALARFPRLFAAGAPIAGGGDPASICAARAVPVRAVHGDADDVIPHSASQEMIRALEACGGTAELVTLEGVDHGSWIPTFKNPAFYAWLLQHRRGDG